jgi:hypothetical protein
MEAIPVLVGDVLGPKSAVTDNRIASWDGTSGNLIQQSQLADGVSGAVLTIAATLTDARTLTLPDANVTITAFGASLIDDADQATARTTLGLGTIATQAANNVDINGGAIDGTTIGATTPSSIAATTISASGLILANGAVLESGENLYGWSSYDNASKIDQISIFSTGQNNASGFHFGAYQAENNFASPYAAGFSKHRANANAYSSRPGRLLWGANGQGFMFQQGDVKAAGTGAGDDVIWSHMVRIQPDSVRIFHTADSASTSTGALIVDGGIGIAKKLYVGDNVSIATGKTLTVDTITATAASVTVSKAVSIAGNVGFSSYNNGVFYDGAFEDGIFWSSAGNFALRIGSDTVNAIDGTDTEMTFHRDLTIATGETLTVDTITATAAAVTFSKVINVSAGKINSGTALPASFADLAAVRTFLATAFV